MEAELSSDYEGNNEIDEGDNEGDDDQ